MKEIVDEGVPVREQQEALPRKPWKISIENFQRKQCPALDLSLALTAILSFFQVNWSRIVYSIKVMKVQKPCKNLFRDRYIKTTIFIIIM